MPGKDPIPPTDVKSGGTADNTSPGTSYAVVGDAAYYDMYDASQFTAFISVLQAPGGINPTLDLRIEQSADLDHWATLLDYTQMTAAGTWFKTVPGPGTSDPKGFSRYIRFTAKVGGTTPTFTYDLVISKIG